MNQARSTAIHEAGHAVAKYRLLPDCTQGPITIIPNDEILGISTSEDAVESTMNPTIDDAIGDVMVLCSGVAAVIVAGVPIEDAKLEGGSDFPKAEEIIATWELASLDDHLARAVDLISMPENQRAVNRLADELVRLGRIIDDEVEMLINIADGEMTEEDLQRYRALKSSPRGAP